MHDQEIDFEFDGKKFRLVVSGRQLKLFAAYIFEGDEPRWNVVNGLVQDMMFYTPSDDVGQGFSIKLAFMRALKTAWRTLMATPGASQ